ncbi:MAG TPA: DUF2249 domain-containing protein [Noviherbaspirillum sp.]|uniref:DUF2249 domain-containing protein n=1 Tax=Noviherbaspirillum sp. TaxID=1926288 RepID=UPI002B499C3F|nr:DUF2249 domain-containing protein [Noviherbaspirillum sp.]HJV85060.1 DUF2249 domain-containing protein [Noviherbaspirillum sp.]
MSNSPQDDIVLDVCGLEPPEPLERVLEALSELSSGRRLRVVIGREPFPLYRILEQNGYAHETRCREDFLYEVLIWNKR